MDFILRMIDRYIIYAVSSYWVFQ